MDLADVAALTAPEGAALLAELAAAAATGADADPVALTTRLRRAHPPALVAAALTQHGLRVRARARFGADADLMLFTPTGLEQATRARVAAYRAARFAALRPAAPVADLCCGVGGDLVALGRAGLTVHGVDRDPVTAAVARANVAALGVADLASVREADVTGVDLAPYAAVACDPARRSGGRRAVDPRAYEPGWDFVRGLLAARTACVKVAPGLDHGLVPAGVTAEWVSDGGEVVEACLLSGAFAEPAPRRATLLPGGATLATGHGGVSGPPPVGPAGGWLYEPAGAVIRAGLVAEVAALVGGRLLDPHVAYVTADAHVPTPFATAYEVREVLPFSVRRLRAYLREHDLGRVTLKKRAFAADLDTLRRDLRPTGEGAEAVVALTRASGKPLAVVCRPAVAG